MSETYKYYNTYYIRSKKHDVYVSNLGNVIDNGKLKTNPTKVLGERIYNVVARLFIPNPDNKPFVDHIDTNRKNNRVDNLRWVTAKENMNNPLTLKHCSEAMKQRIKDGVYDNHYTSMIGRTPWNKGLRGWRKDYYHSQETKDKIGKANKGKHWVIGDDGKRHYMKWITSKD